MKNSMDVYTGSGIFFVRFIVQLFFLLKKVLFSRSTFPALTNKPKKEFAFEFGFCERSQSGLRIRRKG